MDTTTKEETNHKGYSFKGMLLFLLGWGMLFGFTACSDKKDCEEIVPAEARAILRMPSFWISSALQKTGQPSIPCIDFKQFSYAYVTPDGYYAVSIPLKDDADSLVTALKQTDGRFTARGESGDLNWGWWNGSWLFITNGNVLSILGPAIGADERGRLTGTAQQMYRSNSPGMKEGKLYPILEKFQEQEKDEWGFVARLDAVPQPFQELLTAFTLPQSTTAGDAVIVSLPSSSSSAKECITNRILAIDSKQQTVFDEAVRKGKLLQHDFPIDPHALLSMSANVNGKNLMDRLQKNKSIRTILLGLNDVVDMESLLRSAHGDFMLSVSPLSQGFDEMPSFSLTAECDKASFPKDIAHWMKQANKRKGQSASMVGNSYCFTFGGNGNNQKYILITPPSSPESDFFKITYGKVRETSLKPSLDVKPRKTPGPAYRFLLNPSSLSPGSDEGFFGTLLSLFGNKYDRIELKADDAAHSKVYVTTQKK